MQADFLPSLRFGDRVRVLVRVAVLGRMAGALVEEGHVVGFVQLSGSVTRQNHRRSTAAILERDDRLPVIVVPGRDRLLSVVDLKGGME